MFRRQEDTLDADPKYPTDLTKLGYFIDDSPAACVRDIRAPELFFDFHHTNNERHNEVRSEAMRACYREEVLKRLSALGLQQLYLPTLSNIKPEGPHVPILAPEAAVLKTRKRVVVIINDDCYNDLGILAYRELQRETGLNGGSVLNFAKELIVRNNPDSDLVELAKDQASVANNDQVPGLIVLNTGQLLYSHKFNQALSVRSWTCLPRRSICHDGVRIHEVENRVDGHRSPQEHIKTVFDSVIKNSAFVAPGAEVFVVAIENGSEHLLDLLNQDFWKYGERITAIAAMQTPVHSQVTNPELKTFLHTRARQWKVSSDCLRPSICVDLPSDYQVTTSRTAAKPKHVQWLETITAASSDGADHATDGHHHVRKPPQSSESAKSTRPTTWDGYLEADSICPTFSGGEAEVGECIFTQRTIQHAVLEFFKEVAQDSKNYSNPSFPLPQHATSIPEPSPDDPFTLSADNSTTGNADFEPLAQEMLSPEMQALAQANATLLSMKTARDHTPTTDPALAKARQGLDRRIAKKEAEVAEMQEKALATGGVGPGAAQQVRDRWEEDRSNGEKWVPPKTGTAMRFAGVEADSEVVKAAGCLETVKKELERLELEE